MSNLLEVEDNVDFNWDLNFQVLSFIIIALSYNRAATEPKFSFQKKQY